MLDGQKIRVLIVDDSLVMRRLISESLAKESEIEVVGQASNGPIACQKVAELKPDLVTMDVEMPGMSGIEALREIRGRSPKMPVIMFSSLTKQGATTVLEALLAGANDYATKPQDSVQALDAVRAIGDQLIPKIKGLCPKKELFRRVATVAKPTSEQKAQSPVSTPISFRVPVQILCIGTSTGGPNALSDFFKGLPRDFPVPIVIVQHMPPMFTKILAERLEKESVLKFREGEEGMPIEAGKAYVAPGGMHMVVERVPQGGIIHLNEGPPENSCRPSVDVLFRSVVKEYGSGALGLIMTGMGRDGASGCELIRRAGGKILVQNQETSVVWGMPGAVVEAGVADAVLPLTELAGTVSRWVQQSRRK